MTTRASSHRPSRVRWVYIIKAAIAIVALALLYRMASTESVTSALYAADYRFALMGMAVFFYGQYLAAQRWRKVLAEGAMDISRLAALRLNLIGAFIGNFLPGQGSGDVAKAAFLFSKFPGRKTAIMASVIYDRMLGLLATVALASIGALVVGARYGEWHMAVFAYIGLAGFATLTIMLRSSRRLISKEGLLPRSVRMRLGNFSDEFFGYFTSRPLFMRCFTLSIAFQLSWAISVWLMMLAISGEVSVFLVLMAAPLSVLTAAVPISLGGLGIREGVLALTLHQLGMEAQAATAGAVLSLMPLLAASMVGALLVVFNTK